MSKDKKIEEFYLPPEENYGEGFFGKWAYWAMKKKEFLEQKEQENMKDDKDRSNE